MAGISPESLVGIHLTDVPYWHIMFGVSSDELSEVEREYFERGREWGMREGAYAYLQSTKPQTPAHAINDSPAGLAAWIVERLRRGHREEVYEGRAAHEHNHLLGERDNRLVVPHVLRIPDPARRREPRR